MNKVRTLLIVDDIDINRAILADIFEDEYGILEASDGREALDALEKNPDIAAVLLDLLMPGMNGLDVLAEMNKNKKIERIPVFLITAADSEEMLMEGYHLGAVDIISKPFMRYFLKHRISNVIELYAHRNDLEMIVAEQVEQLNQMNQAMVETLANVIEFRDGESGEHVKRICGLTRILMNQVSSMFSEYRMPKEEIEKIVMASILHDVGKISIPDRVLNKPGRLTAEEFEIMKQHPVKGCEMLQNIPAVMDRGIYDYSYDICRHHHERWDGRGYPDGLVGDDITIWAQVVSLADVYDALTAKRVYKDAFSHEKAVQMIFGGECGAFNPRVLKAFEAVADRVREKKWMSHQLQKNESLPGRTEG